MRLPRLARATAPALAALLCLFALAITGCDDEAAEINRFASDGPAELARLAISVQGVDERAVAFADRRGTFYYDALAGSQQHEAMGLISGGFRMLDGWRWWFPIDSVGLAANHISAAMVRPDMAVRKYVEIDTAGFLPRMIRRFQGPEPKRLTEVVTLVEGALIVNVPDSLGTIELFPALSDRAADGYTAEVQGGALFIARSNYMQQARDDPRPVWLAVVSEGGRARTGRTDLAARYPGSLGARSRATAPGRIRIDTPGAVAFAFGMTQEEAAENAGRALRDHDALLRQRQDWLVGGLSGNSLRTEDAEFNLAFDWARIMLEQLVRPDSAAIDLASGIPGAMPQRGWNTLQAMEGAFLSTGRWDRAASIMRHYARNQRFDQRIDVFGRAPSRFDHRGRPQYETADAAAVLVGGLGDYLRTTGHEGLVLGERRLFWTNPVYVQRGFDDPRQLRTSGGFIRNQEGQTWMQGGEHRGGGMRGPESVEIQARYLHNLRTMERLATIMGVRRQAEDYRSAALAFQQHFEQAFVQNDVIADYRDGDGRPASVMRPSALFALRYVDLDPERERQILRRLASEIAYEHGVGTRPQGDSLFYPFLGDGEFFEPEDARYDGTVWTALSGPLISLLVEHGATGRAHEQARSLQRFLIERGVVGAIPENVDAHPRTIGEEERLGVGGAPVQPWSLAEFLRVSFQDFAGIHYAAGNDVVLEPHLPDSWGATTTTFRLGNGSVRAHMRQRGDALEVSLVPQGQLPRNAQVRVRAFGHEQHVPVVRGAADNVVVPADSVGLRIAPAGVQVNGESVPADGSYRQPDPAFWDDFAWAQPEVREEYPVMQRLEEERRLTVDQVARTNPGAVTRLTRTDPVGDDWGRTATFTYPTTYPPRILDATYLQISEDSDAFYFLIEMAALADPAEFGHQPTFFAIAISTEEGGQEQVGRGANFQFDRDRGYNYIVFIGDGLRVEDARGRVLGEFADLGDAVIDTDEARVQFALPKFVVSELPRNTQVTLLVGANEGGQPGRFRPVQPQATSRFGGGKLNPGDPNVYDVITARLER